MSAPVPCVGPVKHCMLSLTLQDVRSSLTIACTSHNGSMRRAVLFDLFETLVTESLTRPVGVSSRAPELGCERESFRRRWKALRPAVTVGHVSFRQALEDIATTLGQHAEGATLDQLCDERTRTKAKAFAHIEDQVLVMLDQLRRRNLLLGVVSNCFAEDVAAWPHCALAARFDCAVFSFEVGLSKPDPGIYLEAIHRLGVNASEAWFIGDGGDDELLGAQQAGLRAFKATWFLRRWPHFREEPSSATSIARVEDVAALVEQAPGPATSPPDKSAPGLLGPECGQRAHASRAAGRQVAGE
jgi:HAD superfamily hydrolase (TIGR01509 family)